MKKLIAILGAVLLLTQVTRAQTPSMSWYRTLDGYADLDKFADVATDADGNVYAAGWSKKSSTDYEWVIIAYNSSGQRQWTHEYDPGTVDTAVAIAVQGDWVYVTGRIKSGTYFQIATLKISKTGGTDANGWPEVWVVNYNCEVRKILVTTGGNVYVAGTVFRSSGSGNGNFLVLEYPSDGGNNGSYLERDVSTSNSYDTLRDMAFDNSGNIIITGVTKNYGSSNVNFATYKCYADLQRGTVWGPVIYDNTSYSNSYDNAGRLSVLSSGEIFVGGTSQSGQSVNDITIIKYNSAGTQQAVMRYSDSGNDLFGDITTDSANSYIYVNGHSSQGPMIVLKYDVGGTLSWSFRYGGGGSNMWGRRIKVDNSNNVWTAHDGYNSTGSGWGVGRDVFLMELNSSGTTIWNWGLDPTYSPPMFPGPDDYIYAMASDGNSGNLYLAGSMTPTTFTNSSSQDFYLIKISTSGGFSQQARFNQGYLEGGSTNGDHGTIPTGFGVSQNYPNPFNPSTVIRFKLPEAANVSLKVFDILGHEIQNLIDNQVLNPGNHEVRFDGSKLASGVYFYRLQAGKSVDMKKMILIK